MHKGKIPGVAIRAKQNKEFLANPPSLEEPTPVVQKQRWFDSQTSGDVAASTVGARLFMYRTPVAVSVIGVCVYVGDMKLPDGDAVAVEALVNGVPTISLAIEKGPNDLTKQLGLSLKAFDKLELHARKWMREDGTADAIRLSDVSAMVSFEKE